MVLAARLKRRNDSRIGRGNAVAEAAAPSVERCAGIACFAQREIFRESRMRAWLALLAATWSLGGCISYSDHPNPAPPTVVVPQGSTVVCPNGSSAIYSNGAYRC
jgi:hypothetical protein